MQIDLLRQFYTDEHTRETVKQFMYDQLKELTIEKAFKKESIDGIYEAKELVDKMFDTLSSKYEPQKKIVVESSR